MMLDHSAVDLARAFRSRSLSPVEVMRAVLARAEAVQTSLNAFRTIAAERALAAARESEARWARGEPIGPLDGVAVAVKDNHAVAGEVTLSGSKGRIRRGPEPVDAPLVARLREAGAILWARTAMPDLGWKGLNDSPLTGNTISPWGTGLTPGGSSGGSAVAVATGCGPLATGGDGGGSIRIPATFTGTYGLKPSTFRVPTLQDSPLGDLVANGFLSRTVADTALALDVVCAPDARDPMAAALAGPSCAETLALGVRGLRIGLVERPSGVVSPDPERSQVVADAARILTDAGGVLEPAEFDAGSMREVFLTLWNAAYVAPVADVSIDLLTSLDPGLLASARDGSAVSMAAFGRAVAARQRYCQTAHALLSRFDLLLLPAMPIPPFAAGVDTPDPERFPHWIDWTPYTWAFNLTRQPAASCPMGLDAAGLPLAVQLVGGLYREDLVLRGSAVLEAARPFISPPL